MDDLRFALHRLADVTEALDEVHQQCVTLRAANPPAEPRLLALLQVSLPELEAEAIRLHALIADAERQDPAEAVLH